MSTGQTLLTIGALALLTLLALNAHRAIYFANASQMETRILVVATGEAENILQGIEKKWFDQLIANKVAENNGSIKEATKGIVPGDFTSPSGLGPDSGEYYPHFNDIDDYHGWSTTISNALLIEPLEVSVTVVYVDPDQPTQTSLVQTTAKRVDITVNAINMHHPLIISRVIYY